MEMPIFSSSYVFSRLKKESFAGLVETKPRVTYQITTKEKLKLILTEDWWITDKKENVFRVRKPTFTVILYGPLFPVHVLSPASLEKYPEEFLG